MVVTRDVIRLCVVGLACSVLVGCITSRHPAGIAESSVPISGEYTPLGKVEESSCRPWFLFFPLGGKAPTHTLLSKLTQEKGADSLVGLTVQYTQSSFFIPIVGEDCTIVKGQAVRVSQ